MHVSLVIFLILSTTFTISEADFDIPLVLDFDGVPECIQACLSDLFYSVSDLVRPENPIRRFQEFCRNYNNASLCVENHKEKCSQTTVFNIALSGIDELCHEKEQDVLQHRECLESHSGTVLNGCDSVCHFTDFMIMLSGKGDAQRLKKLEADKEALQKETGSACTAFGCMSSCVAREFNMNCSPLGSIIVEALTKPFFTIATIFEEIGPRAKISIYRQVPPQCYYLVNYEEIRGLSAGKAPNKVLFKNPEEAILNEITTREEMKSRKKAELEKQFLLEAQMGM